MAAAARLGYRGNWAASALATRRSRLIGLTLMALPDHMSNAMLLDAERALSQSGFGCLLAVSPGPAERMAATAAMLARGVEAVIYAGAWPAGEAIDALAAQSVPWIAVTEDEADDVRRIPWGQAAGGELAARYLLELGHQQLSVVSRGGPWPRGIARALSQSGATLAHATLADADPNAVKLAVLEILDRPQRPSALLCGSDTQALIALRECELLGLRVPEDISVVGFGDEAFAAHTVPALTTVRGSPREIGQQAAAALLAVLEGRPHAPFQPPIRLVIRESTGPAP